MNPAIDPECVFFFNFLSFHIADYECRYPPCTRIERELREFSICGRCQVCLHFHTILGIILMFQSINVFFYQTHNGIRIQINPIKNIHVAIWKYGNVTLFLINAPIVKNTKNARSKSIVIWLIKSTNSAIFAHFTYFESWETDLYHKRSAKTLKGQTLGKILLILSPFIFLYF